MLNAFNWKIYWVEWKHKLVSLVSTSIFVLGLSWRAGGVPLPVFVLQSDVLVLPLPGVWICVGATLGVPLLPAILTVLEMSTDQCKDQNVKQRQTIPITNESRYFKTLINQCNYFQTFLTHKLQMKTVKRISFSLQQQHKSVKNGKCENNWRSHN